MIVTRRALLAWLGVVGGAGVLSSVASACSPVARTIVNGSTGGAASSTSVVTSSGSGHSAASSSGTGGATASGSSASAGGAGTGGTSTACNDGGGCPGGFVCASPTACKTTCKSDADCVSADFCALDTETCVPKNASGAACAADDQCLSGLCLTYCCGVSCGSDPTCSAMSCDTTGACVFADAGAPCGMASCSSAMITPAGSCNGSGSCTEAPAAPCPNGLVCADAVSCLTACGADDAAGDANCQSGYFCAGSAAGCVPVLGTNEKCDRNTQCASGTCGPNNVCT